MQGRGRGRIPGRHGGGVVIEQHLNLGRVGIGVCTACSLKGGDQHRRVVHRLVDDQVRNDPRVGIDHIAGLDRTRAQRRVVRETYLIVVVGQVGGRQIGAVGPKPVVLGDVSHGNARKPEIDRSAVCIPDRRAEHHRVIAFVDPCRRRRTRKLLPGRAIAPLTGVQVVVAPIHAPQAPGQFGCRKIGAEDRFAPCIGLGDLDLLKNELKVISVDGNHCLRLPLKHRSSQPRMANRNGLGSQVARLRTNCGGPTIRSPLVRHGIGLR